jgi:hypothetical protein
VTCPFDGYEVESQLRPQAARYDFDLDAVLDSVVALEAQVPADAFCAASLGAHRIGNGVVLGTEGLVLTIGYLLMEPERVTLVRFRVESQCPLTTQSGHSEGRFGDAPSLQLVKPLAVPKWMAADCLAS